MRDMLGRQELISQSGGNRQLDLKDHRQLLITQSFVLNRTYGIIMTKGS